MTHFPGKVFYVHSVLGNFFWNCCLNLINDYNLCSSNYQDLKILPNHAKNVHFLWPFSSTNLDWFNLKNWNHNCLKHTHDIIHLLYFKTNDNKSTIRHDCLIITLYLMILYFVDCHFYTSLSCLVRINRSTKCSCWELFVIYP